MSLPVVSIVGRPNVGKSSLFNRFLHRNLAVVDEQPGVTRDRNYAICEWAGVRFHLVDTGGMVLGSDDMLEKLVYDQTEFAVHEADLVVFVVDAQVGVDPMDTRIARSLHRADKRTLLVANKVDRQTMETDVFEFLKFGLGEPVAVSATTGRQVGDLLDQLVAALPPMASDDQSAAGVIRVALVGRPNVGKSSFINKLVGEERLIVTPVAGTTRDAVDTPFEYEGQPYVLIDTAGLRRKYKVHENVEFYTNLRTTRAIESCQVAIVLLDASQGATSQDQRILDQVVTARRAAVLAVNKWDLIEKDTRTADQYSRQLEQVLASHAYLPVVYISALTGRRVARVITLVKDVFDESCKRIPTAELNRFLERVTSRKHPPARRGKYIKFNYVAQTEVAPPTFVFFANHPSLIDKTYVAYLTNQLRSQYGFAGVPIRLKFKRK